MEINFDSFDLDNDDLGIIYSLLRNTDNVYIVGGAIRDLLQNKTPKDIDIASDLFPNDIICIFGENRSKITGNVFPTVRVKNNESEIEVSTFRKELGNKFEVSDNIKDDLSRRDFTINSIAFHVLREEIVDPFNGIEDLNNKLIKFVGEPLDRIEEDPTRVLRAIRMKHKINGIYDYKTYKILKSDIVKYLVLTRLPKEQIRNEIFKWLESGLQLSEFFIGLNEINLLEDLFPEFYKALTLDGGKHHNETVFEHCMLAGDAYKIENYDDKNDLLGKLAAYFHDYGKPVCYDKETGRFREHAKIGADLVQKLLINLRFSKNETDIIYQFIYDHMIRPTTLKGIRKFIHKHGENLDYLLKIFDSDSIGNKNTKNLKKDLEENETIRKNIEIAKNEGIKVNTLNLTGFDIMQYFSLKPGPKIKYLKNLAQEFAFENPNNNEKEILLKMLEEFLEREIE